MRIQGKIASFAVAAALSLSMAVPALAAQNVPSVSKTLQMNEGSTVTAKFSYTITPKELSTGNGNEKTYTDGPTAKIADITLTDATSANNTGTGAITFDGKSDASAFTHAGVYAWTIKENTGTYTGNGEMQYDPQVYTLIATVTNGTGGLEFSSFVIVKGDVSATTNDVGNKVNGTSIPFSENKYTENTNDQPNNPDPNNPDNPDNPGGGNTNLVLKKTVAGTQGDKSKQFEFEVTFTAPSVLPNGKTAADVLNAIKPVVTTGKATVTDEGTVSGEATTRTIKFTAADAQYVTFANLLVGTKYSVTETAVDGYTQSYASVANGTRGTFQSDVLVGEKTNNGTMTNTHTDVTPTGLIVDNAPFILLGGVAVAGVVAYGAAKRKLER